MPGRQLHLKTKLSPSNFHIWGPQGESTGFAGAGLGIGGPVPVFPETGGPTIRKNRGIGAFAVLEGLVAAGVVRRALVIEPGCQSALMRVLHGFFLHFS